MYLCAQLVEGVCTQWVEYETLWLLPEGAGLKIGGMLLAANVVAWCFAFVANFLLNKR